MSRTGILKGVMAADEARRADRQDELARERFGLLREQFEENKFISRSELALKLAKEARETDTKVQNFNRQISYLRRKGVDPKIIDSLSNDPDSLAVVYKKVSTDYFDLSPEEINKRVRVVGDYANTDISTEDALTVADETEKLIAEASVPGTDLDADPAGLGGLVTVEFADDTQETYSAEEWKLFGEQQKLFENRLSVAVNAEIATLEGLGKKAEAAALAKDFSEYDPNNPDETYTTIRNRFGPKVKSSIMTDVEKGLFPTKFVVGIEENPYLFSIPIQTVSPTAAVDVQSVDKTGKVDSAAILLSATEQEKASAREFMTLSREEKESLRNQITAEAYARLVTLAIELGKQENPQSMLPSVD